MAAGGPFGRAARCAENHPVNETRTESDSFGPIEVPADALWGAQTARSLKFFAIGEQRMPLEVIHALAWINCFLKCCHSWCQS